MRLAQNRWILAAVGLLGAAAACGVVEVTYLCHLERRGFPWVLWLNGIPLLWMTWLAASRLLRRKATAAIATTASD
jgi:hypothetical protein